MANASSRFIPSLRQIVVICLVILLLLVQLAGWVNWRESPAILRTTGTSILGRSPALTSNDNNEPLPDWRIATDCSTFDLSCATFKSNQRVYNEYPFRFQSKYDSMYDWSTLTSSIPEAWSRGLESSNSSHVSTDVFPDEVSTADYDACVKRTLHDDSYETQLDQVLKRVKRQPDLNMVTFTITDFNYAHDMIHEIFQMNNDVVGFQDAFFMVALDDETVKLGCRYGYPVIAGPSVTAADKLSGDLRANLQSTKFALSFHLLQRNESFFFYEMDVWFIRSPVANLQDFEGDLIVSGHQDNPDGPNIGAYGVRVSEASYEFFQLCCSLLEQAPESHDQFVFWQLWFLAKDYIQKGKPPYREFDNKDGWQPTLPKTPELKHPLVGATFNTGSFSASVHPIVHEKTLALHPLCGAALRSPHGKKIVAKEWGAWYGFHSPADDGGYYARKGERRRYLMLDGRELGGYSWNMQFDEYHGVYHDETALQWTVATLVTLARRTNRILILPKLVHDYVVTFVWPVLDLQSLEGVVDYRETNFAANPKSWSSPSVPFESVARTALGLSWQNNGHEYKWKLFAQVDQQQVQAWKVDTKNPITAWFGFNVGMPQVDGAELLLVNPHFVQSRVFQERLCDKNFDVDDPLVIEIRDVFQNKLRWCSASMGLDYITNKPAAKVQAEDDCYGRGKASTRCNA